MSSAGTNNKNIVNNVNFIDDSVAMHSILSE